MDQVQGPVMFINQHAPPSWDQFQISNFNVKCQVSFSDYYACRTLLLQQIQTAILIIYFELKNVLGLVGFITSQSKLDI